MSKTDFITRLAYSCKLKIYFTLKYYKKKKKKPGQEVLGVPGVRVVIREEFVASSARRNESEPELNY